jgi:sugar lactone lactonase YvrE
MEKLVKLTGNSRLAMLAMVFSIGAATASAQVVASSTTVITKSLGSTTGLAVDQLGNLLASDGVNGALVQLQGSNLAPTNILTGLTTPQQVAVDFNRNVYIANGTSKQVIEIPYQAGSLNLNAIKMLGTGLGTVTGVGVDLSSNVYAVDSTNKQVVKILGSTQTTIASGLTAPTQLAVDHLGNVYIVDSGANSIVEVPAGGNALTFATGFKSPTGIAVDPFNNVYIADTGNGQIDEIPVSTGVQVTLVSGLTSPGSIATDTRGSVYIATGGSILRYTTSATNGIYFGLLPVGTTSQTMPVNITFSSAVNPSVIKVVTTGITGLDYADAGGDTCVANGNYAAGSTCTVNVTFTPGGAGPRYGAIVMYGSNNAVLARVYLGGGGQAALLTTDPGTLNTLTPTGILNAGVYTTLTTPRGLTVDAGGNIFLAEYGYTSSTTLVGPGRITELPAGGHITAYSISSSGLATFTVNNNFTAGEQITLSGFTKSTFLNNQILIVLSSGLSTTQFQAQLASALSTDYGLSGTDPGNAGTPAVVIATTGTNDVAINGAGDLIVASGSGTITTIPYENGTWNFTDVSTLAMGYSRARVARVDVAGNVFWCDAGANGYYAYYQSSASVVTLPYAKYATACLGVTVDLYGNLAYADSSTGKALYVPISGVTPYETGSGFTSAWGIAFDPSGSVWESASGAGVLGRIPNENGVLVGGDQTNSTVGNAKDFDIWVDSSGNLYTTQDSGNQVSSFSIINRSLTTLTFPSTTPTAIGSVSTTTFNTVLSNSGNLPPAYINGGTIGLYDIDDFPQKTPTAGNQCQYATPLLQGFSCNLTFSFGPLSSGTRTASLDFSSNAAVNSVINLTGTASGAVSGTVTLAVALTTPSTGSPSPGQALAVTATATPSGSTAATGAITFYIDGKASGEADLASTGTIAYSIPAGLALGSHTIGVTYAGDKNYAPITTAVTSTVTVVLATATVGLVSSAADIAAGQTAEFSATVPTLTGLAVPTGTITFVDGPATLGAPVPLNASGVATYSTSTLAAGSHSICATYSGDKVYASAKSTCVSLTVGTYAATTTTLTSAPSGSYVYGTPLPAAATVAPLSGSGVPTGSVVFELDGAPVVAARAAGKASVSLTSVGAGAHVLTCYYTGDSTYGSSSCAPASFTVVKSVTATTLATSTTANFASQNVTLTANVSSATSTPSGTVTFYTGVSVIGSATLASGVATLTTGQLPAGADSITAVYVGDANNSTSTSKAIIVTVTLVPSTITVTAAPSVVLSGSPTTLTATLTGTIAANFSGTVTFYSVVGTTSTAVGTATVSGSGVGAFTTGGLTLATNTFTAVYSGSAVFTTSTTASPSLVYVTNPGGAGVIATASLGTGLSSATGVAVDVSGNVYVNDTTKSQIDLIAGGGATQTVSLTGYSAAAGLAADGNGDLYIANGVNGQITEILSQGGALVPTTAKQFGSGLGALVGVAVDNSGNLYVSDATNKQVVKIASGIQTVLNSKLTNPQQVAVDYLGDVYVADGASNHIVYMNAGGTITANIGTGLLNPTGVAVDPAGNIYVSDTGNNRVVKIPFVGGSPSSGGQSTIITGITAPGQLAADRHQALYVTQGTRIYKWQSNAASMGVLTPGSTSPVYTLTFTFQYATTPGEINVLTGGIAGGEYEPAEGSSCTVGTAYAANATCTVNVTFTPQYAGVRAGAVTLATTLGQPLVTAYLGGVGYAPQLNFDTSSTTTITPGLSTLSGLGGTATNGNIRGVASDLYGNIYACDYGNSRIIEINAANTVGQVLYTGAACSSVAVDGAGNVLVDNTTNVLLLPNENGAVNGLDAYIVATGFAGSRGMTFDGFGSVYVGDTTNVRVLVQPIGQSAATQTFPTFTGLSSVYSAAADWQGNIALIDSTAGAIQYLPSNGAAQTKVGPLLCSPYAMAMDAAGTIYVGEIASGCTGAPSPGEDVLRITPSSTGAYTEIAATRAPESVYVDQSGNVLTSYNAYPMIINRTSSPLAAAATIVGTTSAAVSALISNSGVAPATFTAPSGAFYLDSADFATTTTGNDSCAGTSVFIPSYSCTITFTFSPVQSGIRTADYAPLSNSAVTPYVALTGTATGVTASTATTLAIVVTSPASGQGAPYKPMSFTATFTGTGCSGTISLQIDNSFVAVQPAAASVVFTLSAGLAPGFHNLSASYSGTASCEPSVAASSLFGVAGSIKPTLAFTINGLTTAQTILQNQALNPPATAPLVLTAKLTGTAGLLPTGTVRFYDGTTLLYVAPVSPLGIATFTTTSLALGVHNITADYAGDLNYSVLISPAEAITIVFPGDYSLSAAPSPITVAIGSVATITLTATPNPTAFGGNYSGSVSVTCTGLPTFATCTVAPNAILLDGTGIPATATLSVITQALFAESQPLSSSSAIRFALLPAGSLFLLLGVAGTRRRRNILRSARVLTVAIFISLGVLLSGVTACGSHAPLATPTGSYTVTIAGSGTGGVNHTITVPLTITH